MGRFLGASGRAALSIGTFVLGAALLVRPDDNLLKTGFCGVAILFLSVILSLIAFQVVKSACSLVPFRWYRRRKGGVWEKWIVGYDWGGTDTWFRLERPSSETGQRPNGDCHGYPLVEDYRPAALRLWLETPTLPSSTEELF